MEPVSKRMQKPLLQITLHSSLLKVHVVILGKT
jgi:hypothetical protein